MSLGLVDYSCSSSSEDDAQPNEGKTQTKLPNPLRATAPSTLPAAAEDDDASNHNGRMRSFAHERGIWATYVHVACRRTESIELLQSTLKNQIENDVDFNGIEMHAVTDLHMSLTRTVILRHHWIDEFIRSITNAIKSFVGFQVLLNQLRIYCNDERTRTFLSLSLNKNDTSTSDKLSRIVDRLDRCLDEFNLPPFYEEKSFHVSILWCLGDQKSALQNKLAALQLELDRSIAMETDDFQLDARQIKCQSGNKSFAIDLPFGTST